MLCAILHQGVVNRNAWEALCTGLYWRRATVDR